LTRLPTLLRTLWYLRATQVLGQLRRRMPGAKRPRRHPGPVPGLRFTAAATGYLPGPAHAVPNALASLRLLNREMTWSAGIVWDSLEHGPLWAYHLHQFDWARSIRLSPDQRLEAMQDWVRRHPRGIGWHGGPISLRTFAWGKLLTTPGALPPAEAPRRELLASLADQLTTLSAELETQLMANHYLWNLLALVFGGIVLEGGDADRWLAHGERLATELEEQVLADGAHFERSPMYHGLILENLLDLLNAMRAAPGRAPAALEAQVASKAAAMLGAHRVWVHPDGEIGLFGDSALGIAHPPDVLARYATSLGVAPRDPDPPGALRAAGYARLEAGPFVLIASASTPLPPYQPGHAHCDALSFELSVSGQRVVTDTGVTEYLPGPLRQASRATASHATVQLGEEEQAELWAAHRIGGRPDVALTRLELPGLAEGVCAGWATPTVLHRRRFQASEAGIEIHDSFDEPAARACLRLPLAPDLEPRLEGDAALLPLRGASQLRISLPPEAEWRIDTGPYFPEFGRVEERKVLVGEASDLSAAVWKFRIES
jgi:hypothetical protein